MRARTSDLGDRTTYLGATDMGALIGVDPYKTALDVWRRVVEGYDPPAGEAAEIGLALEPVICDLYERRHGARLVRRNEYRHPEHDWLRVHPDRLVVGEDAVMDAKASMFATGYGEPETDQVPPSVRCQMVTLCGVMSKARAYVAVFRGTRGIERYVVPADPALYDALVAEAVRFREEHWLPGVPPPVDGSEAYGRYLAERYPRDDGTELVATPEQALLVEELAAAKAASKAAKAREELAGQRIKDAMGEATALLSPAGRVTWKQQTRASYVVDEVTFRKLDFRPAKGAQEEAA